jgi:hypothetical protein
MIDSLMFIELTVLMNIASYLVYLLLLEILGSKELPLVLLLKLNIKL